MVKFTASKIIKKLFQIFLFSFVVLNNAASEITYKEILKDPTNLELNLQYAKEQEEKKNYKSTIATLERLSAIYSNNLDLKLYLLSISLRIDSKERTKSILNDIKKSPKLTNDLRAKIETIDEALLKQSKQDKSSDWARYVDIGTNFFQENNVNTVSDTKTFYISDSLSNYAADTVYKDDYQDTFIRAGAFKKLSDTSSINFNLGKSYIRQNNDKPKENDLRSLFVNYNKQLNKNFVSTYYSSNEYNYIHEADFVVHSLTLEDRYNFKPNQNILISGNVGLTEYRTNEIFGTVDAKNNQSSGLGLGYEYFFSGLHHVKLKLGFNDYNARVDTYGYENSFKTITYTNNFKSINVSLSRSINNNIYDKADSFIKAGVIRDDEITTDTLSIYGNLDGMIKSNRFNFLKNIYYSYSHSEIQSESNILNYDYNKDINKFGLTKRIMF